LFVLADCLALAWWAWVQVQDPNTLSIQRVRIEGEFRQLKPAQLQATVEGQVKGGFFAVRVDDIRHALQRNPWVKSVAVRRIWPDGLQVTVVEKRAVAMWGERGLLDPEGEVFSPSKESYPPGLIRLDGPPGTEAMMLTRLGELRGWMAPLGVDVDGLTLTSRRAWSFALKEGPTVVVGRMGFGERLGRFVDEYPNLLSRQWNDLERVDLRYTNGFTVSLRKPGGPMAQQQNKEIRNGEKAG
jgi:cell division protein FtsQ